MKLPHSLTQKTFGDERPRAPQAIMHVPPRGSAVHCVSVEQAQEAAQQYAAENPGRTVAVYQLVGYAFRPIEAPEFTPAESDKAKAELLDCAPDSEGYADGLEPHGDVDVERPDLSPQQRETLQRLRAARRGDSE